MKYKTFMASLESEIKARKILLTALDQADRFYRNQRRDVKKVVYVSFPKTCLEPNTHSFLIFRLIKTLETESSQSKASSTAKSQT